MRFIIFAVFLLISIAFLYNSSLATQDISKGSSKTYSKEQIAKQNILNLFRWIEAGDLENREAKNAIVLIRRQLDILNKESALQGKPAAEVYVYLSDSFFKALIREYKFESSNMLLLNRLFVEAAKRSQPNKNVREVVARHPWMDIKNNLLDCLENEVIINKVDLSKPEIFVAPEIDSVVGLVEGGFSSALKTQVNLSGAYRLVHKGSTARGTSLDNADFDYDLLFENEKDLDKFLKKLSPILNLLTKRWKAEGYSILSKSERRALPKKMVNLIMQDNHGVIFMLQIFIGKNIVIYVDRLNAQIEQIKALGGSWDYLKGQIILFKKLIRGVLHSYRITSGGLDGMGCEQFIVQVGSSTGYGRKMTGVGSFDKTMHWIYGIGFDQASATVIPFDKVANQIGIYYKNTYKYTPIVCTPLFWDKLVNAARKYVKLAKTEMSEEEFASLGKMGGN